jgi:hypothetical protein
LCLANLRALLATVVSITWQLRATWHPRSLAWAFDASLFGGKLRCIRCTAGVCDHGCRRSALNVSGNAPIRSCAGTLTIITMCAQIEVSALALRTGGLTRQRCSFAATLRYHPVRRAQSLRPARATRARARPRAVTISTACRQHKIKLKKLRIYASACMTKSARVFAISMHS